MDGQTCMLVNETFEGQTCMLVNEAFEGFAIMLCELARTYKFFPTGLFGLISNCIKEM